ncbi:MAG: hypothetical protein MJZ52_07085 [Bacteroidales bacterium]|nr:hypothetical protein [Bacteroidales bacterium]
MKDNLITIISTLGFPIIEQGSLNPNDDYPESFFTFWNPAADGGSFYDDDEHDIVWMFELNFYSSDPQLVNTKLLEAKRLLKQNGWIASGAGHDVASDETTHTGRGMTVTFIEKLN